MAGTEKHRSNEQRNTVTMGVATQNSISDRGEEGAQVTGLSQAVPWQAPKTVAMLSEVHAVVFES
jgi:hypothetical protein